VSVSKIGQDLLRIGRDGENGEILEAQRITEAYLSPTRPFERILFFSEYHATETSHLASHGRTMYGTAHKTPSSYALMHGIHLRAASIRCWPRNCVRSTGKWRPSWWKALAMLSVSRRFRWCKVDESDGALFRCANCCGRNRSFSRHPDGSAGLLPIDLQ